MGDDQVLVRPRAARTVDDGVRLAAEVSWPGSQHVELWIDVPTELAPAVVDSADPWVLAGIHLAMVYGVPLHVDGPVSPSLLANLVEFQAAIAAWSERPRWPGAYVYRQVEVTAAEVQERERPSHEVVAAFSGGLDSAFSVARHVRGEAGAASRSIGAAVMVAGFDIPLDQPDTFAAAFARARLMTEDLGVALHAVRTNLRVLDLAWPEVFPAAVMSVLTALGGRFGGGLLATGRRWDWLDLPDDGSSPAWDWMLGSDAFTAIHDGAAFDRPEKVASLRSWDVGRRNLRVCWAGDRLDRNCGRCRKCVGTYLLFRCYDLEPDCFDEVPADDELPGLVALDRPTWTIAYRYGESLLAAAREQGLDEPWVDALARSLFRDRRRRDLDRVRRILARNRPGS